MAVASTRRAMGPIRSTSRWRKKWTASGKGLARSVIGWTDKWHLLPRSYLWGLADTFRTGVEGRGLHHFFFGKWYTGHPPVFFWPGLIASKVPLFLLALVLLGGAALWRAPLTREMRALLFCTAGVAGAHLVALLSSEGTWGGIRHALPLDFIARHFGGSGFLARLATAQSRVRTRFARGVGFSRS